MYRNLWPKTSFIHSFIHISQFSQFQSDVNLHGDDLLGDIMSELHQKPSPSTTVAAAPQVKLKRKAPPKTIVNPFSTKVQKRANPVKALAPIDSNKSEPEPEPPKEEIKPEPEPVAPVSRPKPQIRTALDCIDPDLVDTEPEIEEVVSQDKSMDVSGIDFDDDFGAENMEPKAELPEVGEGGKMWETIKGSQPDIPMDIQVDPSQLPMTTDEDGEQVMRMYWIDAYEDQYKQPGMLLSSLLLSSVVCIQIN